MTVWGGFGMIIAFFRGVWSTWGGDFATFDSFGRILNDKSGLEMQVGYVEGRCGYI